MATYESRRRDLYNGLTEVLGIERADTLMQFLPSIEGSQQATRTDIYGLSGRIDDAESSLTGRIDNVESSLTTRIDNVERSLTTRIDNVERSLTSRIDNVERDLTARIDKVEGKLTTRIDRFEHSVTARFDAMNLRLDRIVLTLAAGLMAIIAALIAQNFF
ncbi:MAG: hypothetical protein ACFCU2_07805 [Acidimicrobiia bacterium]